MKIKVGLCDRRIIGAFLTVIGIISSIISIVFIFVTIPNNLKIYFAIALIGLFIFIYIGMFINANIKKSVKVTINNTRLEIIYGDLFKVSGLKVIGFNEYFDTIVDNVIISEKSLHGKFIKQYISDINEFDRTIENGLGDKKFSLNNSRLIGKKKRYKLGTLFEYKNEFIFTSFAKFDDRNRACLTLEEYIEFLISFWNEIDVVNNGRDVNIPLMGSGITRFNSSVSKQELLELILFTLKYSGIKLCYGCKIRIILHKSVADEINLYNIKGVFSE